MIRFNQVQYQYETMSMMFNFNINKGDLVSVLGPSGAGKSTLLSLIAGFIKPTSGQIILNNQDETFSTPGKRPVSMLFQDNNLFTHLTVEQNLALGLSPSLKLTSLQQQLLLNIVDRLGLGKYLASFPHQLSGGQKQRVALGRCLMQHRPILLLDEPFSSFDSILKQDMFKLLFEVYNEYQLTILMVTHQLEDIPVNNDKCLIINKGKIEFDGLYRDSKNHNT